MVYLVSERPSPEPTQTVLTYSDLRAKGITLSLPSLWRLERAGAFPRRFNLSPGRVGWLASEIDQYIAAKVAERDAKPKPSNMSGENPTRRRRGRPPKKLVVPPPLPPLPEPVAK